MRTVLVLLACLVAWACEEPHPSASSSPSSTVAGAASAAPVLTSRPAEVFADVSCDQELTGLRVQQAIAAGWTEDGSRLLLSVDGNARRGLVRNDPQRRRLRVLDVRTGEVTDIGDGARPTWSADGALVAFPEALPPRSDVPTDIVIYDTSRRREVGRIPQSTSSASPRWVGDALVHIEGREVRRWQAGIDHVLATLPFSADRAYAQLSADARVVVLALGQREVMPSADWGIYDVATGRFTVLPGAWSVTPSRQGHRLVVSYERRTEIREEDGSVLPIDAPVNGLIQWSPDGRRPLYTEPAIYYGDQPPTQELLRLDGTPSGVVVPTFSNGLPGFSPDGSRYARIYNDGWGTIELRVYACARAAQPPRERPSDVTLYYPESEEPWAVGADGTGPPGWRDLLRAELVRGGLHPLVIDRVATVRPPGCETCGTGFAAEVRFPRADLALALDRCFLFGDPPRYVPEGPVPTYQCRPLSTRSSPDLDLAR